MFIGHYAFAFGLKRFVKKLSLGWLFIAVALADLLWAGFILLGWEKVRIVPGITKLSPIDLIRIPYSHSLLSTLILVALALLILNFLPLDKPTRKRMGTIFAIAISSHFILDVISHRPDMPIFFSDSPKIGLGLWNHVFWSYFIETGIFVTGFLMYILAMGELSLGKKIGIGLFAGCLIGLNFLSSTGARPPGPEDLGHL